MSDDDTTTAKVDGQLLHGRSGTFDITGIDDVEIVIKADGRALWINAPDLRGADLRHPRNGYHQRHAFASSPHARPRCKVIGFKSNQGARPWQTN